MNLFCAVDLFEKINFDVYFFIDVAAVLLCLIWLISFFRKHNSLKIAFIYVMFIVLIALINVLYYMNGGEKLKLTKTIADVVAIIMIAVFAVVYQSSLKAGVVKICRHKTHDPSLLGYVSSDEELSEAASEIVKATQSMSKNDTGAIIIIAPSSVPEHIIKSGTKLDALLSAPLLESIFNKKSPLHDGAVVVRDNKVVAAGCFLPLSQDISISKDLGTRHRAAVGITEETDVLSIVVSEETGIISTVSHSEIRRYMTPEKLQDAIEQAYGIKYQPVGEKKKFIRK